MKNNSKILILTLVSLFQGSAAFAATSYEKSYVESYSGRGDTVPVPVSVVAPELPGRLEASRVMVKFIVDESGKPRDISLPGSVDRGTALAITEAVSAWKFAPAKIEGKPVAKRVAVPFDITLN